MLLPEDIFVDQGVDYPEAGNPVMYTWQTQADDGTRTAVDLTGWTSSMVVKASRNVGVATLLTLTDGAGITLGGTAGTIRVAITGVQSNTLPMGPNNQSIFVYDLILTAPTSAQTLFMGGNLYLKAVA